MAVDLNVAAEHLRRGQLDQAASACEAALANKPDDPDALCSWAWCYCIGKSATRRSAAFARRSDCDPVLPERTTGSAMPCG